MQPEYPRLPHEIYNPDKQLDYPPDEKIPGYEQVLALTDEDLQRYAGSEQFHTDDRRIVQFYRFIRYYVLDYAAIFALGCRLESVEVDLRENIVVNSSYAVLLLINAIPDLVGQLIGTSKYIEENLPSGAYNKSQTFEKFDQANNDEYGYIEVLASNSVGFHYFFQDCLVKSDYRPYYVYYQAIRNGLSHLGRPKIVFVHRDLCLLKPLAVRSTDEEKVVLAINIPEYYRRIREKFDDYVRAIRSPSNQEEQAWRTQFFNRYDKIRKPKPYDDDEN